ncbi:SpoIIE family protein phosphatase [Streptomyces sp. NPDC008150]|uniref:SpoIIE family protein phosphatase n=1 Tax=Streptomyces sp. NPDC008150 TaxID=3364816 RepID=UPI0036EDC838
MIRRLDILDSADDSITESEVFRLALQQSMAELDCIGGYVHLRGPMSALRLVTSAGLPSSAVQAWDMLAQDAGTATSRAVDSGEPQWDAPDPADGSLLSGTGRIAVPVLGRRRTIGVLTLLTGSPERPPPEQWDFLRRVTEWIIERLRRIPTPAPLPASGQETPMVGSWDWNIDTAELVWDDAAMLVYDTDPADFGHSVESWMRIVHPEDMPGALAAAERTIRTHVPFEVEYRVRRRLGGWVWTRAAGHAVLDGEGNTVRVAGECWVSDVSPTARDALNRALRHMSDAFLAVDDHWDVTFANLKAEQLLGSDEDAPLPGRRLWDLPALRQVPDLEERFRGHVTTDRAVGFDITLADTGRVHHLRVVPVPGGLTVYLTDVTDERRRETEKVETIRAGAERATRTAELTSALAAATTTQDVIDAVARGVLPPFDAQGLLVLVTEADDRIVHIGSVGYPQDFLDRMSGSGGMEVSDDNPVGRAVLTGEPAFFRDRAQWLSAYPDIDRTGTEKHAWAFLPLTTSGRTFGVCVVAFDSARSLGAEERTLLITISALVAQALERARLYDAELNRSRELQRELLPRRLPDLVETTATARYLPAGQSADVGGDWYDIIPLSAGQVALVIGDVMGHGLPEAATMGRLRTALHTLAALELPPDEIMGHLNEIVAGLGPHAYATCLYALYDSPTGTCTVVRAGHPPPLIVHPDGAAHYPHVTSNPPLGCAEPPFETTELTLPPESLLVLYTDGLVESRHREIDEGMAQLAALVPEVDGESLEKLSDAVIDGLLPDGTTTSDDAALLVARLHALSDRQVASWQLPDGPEAAGEARRHVREQLAAWDLEDMAMTTELLASELVGNGVRHAKGPMLLRLLRTNALICEVSDTSLTMPRIRRASETDEGGRGLQLIGALASRWGSRFNHAGKTIWTEQALPSCEGRDNGFTGEGPAAGTAGGGAPA